MSEALIGKTLDEAKILFQQFHNLMTKAHSEKEDSNNANSDLGKLVVLSGVSEFPMRVKCATLAWHTFISAIHHDQKPVSTE